MSDKERIEVDFMNQLSKDKDSWVRDEFLDFKQSDSQTEEVPISKREIRKLMRSSMLAALMVAGVYILAMFLFILFCVKVWF